VRIIAPAPCQKIAICPSDFFQEFARLLPLPAENPAESRPDLLLLASAAVSRVRC
jgi:hypothetical protein